LGSLPPFRGYPFPVNAKKITQIYGQHKEITLIPVNAKPLHPLLYTILFFYLRGSEIFHKIIEGDVDLEKMKGGVRVADLVWS